VLDGDYTEGQVEYQKGNAALFQYEIQNGTDPDLKKFAQDTLPEIEDRLQRAMKFAEGDGHQQRATRWRIGRARAAL
jgi:putative membrane protein